MHVDNELVEFMSTDEQDYEEIIEEYKKEIFVQEGALEPSVADFVYTPPTQGKPQCITIILNDHWIYIWCAFMLHAFYGNYMYR